MESNKLIPDWEQPKSIGLVWPNKLPDGRKYLVPFYTEFIELLQEHCSNVSLKIIHRPGGIEKLNKLFTKGDIVPIEKKDVQDIWIRDFAPLWKRVGSAVVAVKAHYYPKYGGDVYLKYSKHDDEIGRELGGKKVEDIKVGDTRVILDGGNLTHNGKGLGICTNRLLTDNEKFFSDKVFNTLKDSLCLSKLLIIPTEIGDDTGHVDGLVRFIRKDTVIVSEYPYVWKTGQNYIHKSEYLFAQNQLNQIAEYLDNLKLKVFRIPNGVPVNGKDGFESALGNYTNFFRIGDIIFIPQYGRREQDQNAVNALIKADVKKNNIVRVPGCAELAKLGGVLNCVTTHIYN